jgi:beta-lactamase class A
VERDVTSELSNALSVVEKTLEGGTLGVAATFLPTGDTVFYNADEIFPTASVIKISIVSELFTQEAEGRLLRESPVTVQREDFIAGSGVLATLTPGLTLPLADLAMLTISVSDNTASNLCLRSVGGPDAVNQRMRETWGLTATTIHRPIKFELMPDDPPHTATGSPRDMMRLVALLAKGEVHSRGVSDEVLRLMANVRDNELLPRYLTVNPYADALKADRPPFVARRKTGAVSGVRNDAGLISRSDETLAVCVYTKGCPDPRWTAANQGSEAVAQVGQILTGRFFV